MLCYIILCCVILYYVILCCYIILYYIILCCAILYHIILYCIVLYFIVWLKYIAIKINVMQVSNILRYCTLSKKLLTLKYTNFNFLYVRINIKVPCDSVCDKNICCATYNDCRATESLCSAMKNFSHVIEQLLHQYHKTLALCNILWY